jgi:hypothetical protein
MGDELADRSGEAGLRTSSPTVISSNAPTGAWNPNFSAGLKLPRTSTAASWISTWYRGANRAVCVSSQVATANSRYYNGVGASPVPPRSAGSSDSR